MIWATERGKRLGVVGKVSAAGVFGTIPKGLMWISAECEGEEKECVKKFFEKIIVIKLSKFGNKPAHSRSSTKPKLDESKEIQTKTPITLKNKDKKYWK